MVDSNGAAMHAGALTAGHVYSFTYDGTSFELQSPAADTLYAEGGSYAADTGAANAYVAAVPGITSLAAGVTCPSQDRASQHRGLDPQCE